MISIATLPSLPFESRKNLPKVPSVYFALKGSTVLYVGRSICLGQRWRYHHKELALTTAGCDRIAWLESSENLDEIERRCIATFSPLLNGSVKTDRRLIGRVGMMVGSVIYYYRVDKFQGLRSLAREIGVSHGTLSRIERGEEMDAKTLVKILAWLFSEA